MHAIPYHNPNHTLPSFSGSNMLPSHPLVPADDPPSDRWERSHHKSGKERLPCSLQLDGWLKPQPTAVEAKGLVSERSKQGTPGQPIILEHQTKTTKLFKHTDSILQQHNNPSIFPMKRLRLAASQKKKKRACACAPRKQPSLCTEGTLPANDSIDAWGSTWLRWMIQICTSNPGTPYRPSSG